jgi:hypothetical protein
MVGKVEKLHGTRSELNSVFGLGKRGLVEPHQNIHHTVQISPHAISGLSNHERGASRQISK